MVMWFRKSAVFYLPPGWFGPAQRILSWPFAPAGKKEKERERERQMGGERKLLIFVSKIGSVSVAVWFAACRRVIKAVALTVNDFVFTPAAEKKVASSVHQ